MFWTQNYSGIIVTSEPACGNCSTIKTHSVKITPTIANQTAQQGICKLYSMNSHLWNNFLRQIWKPPISALEAQKSKQIYFKTWISIVSKTQSDEQFASCEAFFFRFPTGPSLIVVSVASRLSGVDLKAEELITSSSNWHPVFSFVLWNPATNVTHQRDAQWKWNPAKKCGMWLWFGHVSSCVCFFQLSHSTYCRKLEAVQHEYRNTCRMTIFSLQLYSFFKIKSFRRRENWRQKAGFLAQSGVFREISPSLVPL